MLVMLASLLTAAWSPDGPVTARHASPVAGTPASCSAAATPTAGHGEHEATPGAEHATMPAVDGHGAHGDHGAPATLAATAYDFDLVYIDMMLPHHESVVALAQAALPALTVPDLQMIATTIIETQTAERTELTGYREQFYGSPDPLPMDAIMPAMAALMPEAHDLMMMDMDQMDASALVASFCTQTAGAAPGAADRVFIDLVIPHHESAIAASRPALTDAIHPEIRAFAQRVIDGQQAEIDQMTRIRETIPS
jgi:uncharacterized protein (DUF305 family)